MAKLYFRYGTMGSAKTLNLLAVAHNYRQQGKKVVLLKPEIDTRFGSRIIRSRAGIKKAADILVKPDTVLDRKQFTGVSCILVDEVQFISPQLIEQLRSLSIDADIPVICYGLRTNFRSQLFEGPKRLFELADSIEEIKTTCSFCNRKAVMNLKHVNGVAVVDGPEIDLGTEEKYLSACYKCYKTQIEQAAVLPQNAVGA